MATFQVLEYRQHPHHLRGNRNLLQPSSFSLLKPPQVALAPTGKILFFSRYPAMLGVSVLSFLYTASHSPSYRLQSQPLSTLSNYVVGMGLLYQQSIQGMRKYTSMILVRGSWDLQQKHGTALDLHPTFASAICKY